MKNKILKYYLFEIIIIIAVYSLSGFWGLYYFIIIAVISILFLETVNYIEHYGLQRKKTA